MNEKKLVGAIKSGDTAALGRLIDRYSGYVCTVARNFGRGALTEEDIDEVAADVFFNLWEHRDNLDGNIGLRPYLSAAVRNALKNRFKRRLPECEDIEGIELPSGSFVEEAAELHEIMSCLDGAFARLSDEEREVFFRFYYYGESSSGIAEKTGISESTVRSKLCRVRGKLREYLKERGFDNVG